IPSTRSGNGRRSRRPTGPVYRPSFTLPSRSGLFRLHLTKEDIHAGRKPITEFDIGIHPNGVPLKISVNDQPLLTVITQPCHDLYVFVAARKVDKVALRETVFCVQAILDRKSTRLN